MKKTIPAEILTQHAAVLGKTGSGKTSTAKLAIEQVCAEGARVCILDPIKSDWWGLTSSRDGKHAGLPFHILGGPRGHVSLHSGAGRAIGELVGRGELPLSIVDMADFEPGGVQRFFVDFAPALMRHMRGVLYLVVEEAHEFAPKERAGFGAENQAIHFAKKLATAGRSKGIRLIVLTQRVQALHNALLGSCDTLIAHRLTAPADQKPVLDWLKANVEKAIADQVAGELAQLRTGSGWICSGEARIFERREFPRISTYDNTATPDSDSHAHDVKTAPVDAEKLRAVIGEAVAQAEADDPKKLKAKLAELERKLAAVPAAKPVEKQEVKIERVAVPALTAEEGQALNALVREAQDLKSQASHLGTAADSIDAAAHGLVATIDARLKGMAAAKPTQNIPRNIPAPVKHSGQLAELRKSSDSGAGLTGPEQRILDALVDLLAIGVNQPEREMVAFLAGYSNLTSKGFANGMGALKTRGYIDYPAQGRITITPEGRGSAKSIAQVISNEDLHERICRLLGGPSERLLRPLLATYPREMSRESLAQAAGYGNLTSKGFANAIGRMRSLGFISYPDRGTVRANEVLFPVRP